MMVKILPNYGNLSHKLEILHPLQPYTRCYVKRVNVRVDLLQMDPLQCDWVINTSCDFCMPSPIQASRADS